MHALSHIEKFWFMPAPAERLAVLRIASGSFCLWYLLSRFPMLQKMAASDVENFSPIGIIKWMDQPLDVTVFWWFTVILIVLNVFFIAGWKFKYIGPLFAVLLLIFFTYRNSWSMVYHNRNALILHLIILGLVTSADALSLDAWKKGKNGKPKPMAHWRYGWPIKLICAGTLGTYFLSGIAKLTGDLALEWANGSAMRSQVAVDAIRKEILGSEIGPLFEVIYSHTWLFLGMGILTLILEVGAPFALLKKRVGRVWAITTGLMHWGIFFIMGISFRYQMTGLIFLSFFEPEKLLPHRKQNRAEGTISERNRIPAGSSVQPVILFDGICNLCNASVRFILQRDQQRTFDFASLQSEVGRRLLKDHHISADMSSVVLIEGKQAYQKSDAVLRISKHLGFPWRMGRLLMLLPKPFRDGMYDLIASNRYQWFGKKETCTLIPGYDRSRFLNL